jgi:2-polyprenyl-6-methoxyphenol hydroxylase-like FAD-dependent oxidoreductase
MIGGGGKIGGGVPPSSRIERSVATDSGKAGNDGPAAEKHSDSFERGAKAAAEAKPQPLAKEASGTTDVLRLARENPAAARQLVATMAAQSATILSQIEQELAGAAGSEAGVLTLASERASWPLVVGGASRWCGPGWVLVGDAAHVVHPLAGQGLNLGLADVASLTEVLAQREPWRPLGDERLLRRYERQRAAPTWAMRHMTDGLLRLFATPSAPIRELRNNGMSVVNRVAPLKRWLTARALDS